MRASSSIHGSIVGFSPIQADIELCEGTGDAASWMVSIADPSGRYPDRLKPLRGVGVRIEADQGAVEVLESLLATAKLMPAAMPTGPGQSRRGHGGVSQNRHGSRAERRRKEGCGPAGWMVAYGASLRTEPAER
jgi:hypothetical protein